MSFEKCREHNSLITLGAPVARVSSANVGAVGRDRVAALHAPPGEPARALAASWDA